MAMVNKKVNPLRGFRDFMPDEARKREWLKERLASIFESWGYQPIESPTLESLEIFVGQIGEDEKLFYQFEDPGGRQVALRYDQTVPTCRMIGRFSGKLPIPFRRYQIQPVFRAERPQKGRYREFLQADADMYGVAEPEADAELIALSLDVYRQLGFEQVVARINDRSLLQEFPYEALSSIDKIHKIGSQAVVEDMVSKGISTDTAWEYLSKLQNLQPNETISRIFAYLADAGFDEDWYQFDPTIARSFSYSQGPIWEITLPDDHQSLLGGERYDGLVENVGGVSVPATGFGLGFDRTLEAAESRELLPVMEGSAEVLIANFDPDSRHMGFEVAADLRAEQVRVEMYPIEAKLGKQFKYADGQNIPWVLLIGADERAANTVTLRNMKTSENVTISRVQLIDKIWDLLSQ